MFLSRQQGRSETEEYSSDSESESEDEEELQMILEDLQKQNEELEVRKAFSTHWLFTISFIFVVIHCYPSVVNYCVVKSESKTHLRILLYIKL